MSDDVKLNWSTAQVKDSKLSVELEGEVPKGWKQSFETTVRLLGNGDWGEVSLKKKRVSVAELTPGTEEKLRFFLDSAVAQANADQESGEDEQSRSDGEEAERSDSDDDDVDHEQQGPDAQMTEQFRSFGG